MIVSDSCNNFNETFNNSFIKIIFPKISNLTFNLSAWLSKDFIIKSIHLSLFSKSVATSASFPDKKINLSSAL